MVSEVLRRNPESAVSLSAIHSRHAITGLSDSVQRQVVKGAHLWDKSEISGPSGDDAKSPANGALYRNSAA